MQHNYRREQRGEQDLRRRRVKNRERRRSVKVSDERGTRSMIGYLGRTGGSLEALNQSSYREKIWS